MKHTNADNSLNI